MDTSKAFDFGKRLLPLIAATALLGLVGCQNTGQGMKEDTDRNTEQMKESTENAREEAKETGEEIAATTLTARIKSAFVANPLLNDEGVKIDVNSTPDKVDLDGHVKTQEQKDMATTLAEQILKETEAKQELHNNLVIQK